MTDRIVPADPRRVEVGRMNRAKWKGFTAAGLARLRQSALEHRPWRFATGPRTAEGKRIVAANGRRRCRGDLSIPQARAEVARANALLGDLAELRRLLLDGSDPGGAREDRGVDTGAAPFVQGASGRP
jgi:hypothetical protein